MLVKIKMEKFTMKRRAHLQRVMLRNSIATSLRFLRGLRNLKLFLTILPELYRTLRKIDS